MRSREFSLPKKNLIIFDIDDTLLHTTAKIKVVKNGQVVCDLTNQEFNNYTLKPGEEFDFGEFRNAEKFNRESKPIEPMINKLKTILAHSGNSDVIMLTARADFDNRDLFLKTFTNLGIDMSRVHVHRAGDLPGDEIPAEKKAVYVRNYAKTGKYDHIRLYDDSRSNLEVFKNLKTEFPDIDFRAYYVGEQGKTSIHEGISNLGHHKSRFLEMFKKFLPLAMHYLKLKSLPKMKFVMHVRDATQPTFGQYVNNEKTLYVALSNRHPNDILRTVAHELQHYKQDIDHRLTHDAGKTGSPFENEAHAMGGIVMRHFNKKYPEYLNDKPIIAESIGEAKYAGNLGVMELIKFFKEHPELKSAYDEIKIKKGAVEALKFALKAINANLEGEPYKVAENFADGKVKGKSRPGRVKRAGASCSGSVTDLRQKAKQGGEKGKMYHWCANMKAGKK